MSAPSDLDLVPAASSSIAPRSSIRMAGIADIPAVARITQEGPPRADVDPEMLARATRLQLTHVAFERGALWIEQGPDGSIRRAVAVVPGAEMSLWETIGRVVAPDLGTLDTMAPPDADVAREFRAELAAAAPAWILSEISKVPDPRPGNSELLAAALDWVRTLSDDPRGLVAVVADTAVESDTAESLGFVESRTRATHPGWWLGVCPEPVGAGRD